MVKIFLNFLVKYFKYKIFIFFYNKYKKMFLYIGVQITIFLCLHNYIYWSQIPPRAEFGTFLYLWSLKLNFRLTSIFEVIFQRPLKGLRFWKPQFFRKFFAHKILKNKQLLFDLLRNNWRQLCLYWNRVCSFRTMKKSEKIGIFEILGS
jgi:hypothetical protein